MIRDKNVFNIENAQIFDYFLFLFVDYKEHALFRIKGIPFEK